MKNNKIIKLKLNEELSRKLLYVCEKEGLSLQNQLSAMIRQKIAYFERVKGNIPRDALSKVDISVLDDEE
jgi:hypothetical protein